MQHNTHTVHTKLSSTPQRVVLSGQTHVTVAGSLKCKPVHCLVFGEGEQSLCTARQDGSENSGSVPEDVDVVVEADRRTGGSTVHVAHGATAAALDPHDLLIESLPIAVEAKPHSAGHGGRATAAVGAGPAGARTVRLFCGASSKCDSERFLRTDGSLTLFPPLDGKTGRDTIKMWIQQFPHWGTSKTVVD